LQPSDEYIEAKEPQNCKENTEEYYSGHYSHAMVSAFPVFAFISIGIIEQMRVIEKR
jgi:hypothetical protein